MTPPRTWLLSDLEKILGPPSTRGTTFTGTPSKLAYAMWPCFLTALPAEQDITPGRCPPACIALTGWFDPAGEVPLDQWTIEPCARHRASFELAETE